jgi:hypothetical protein
VLRFSSTTAGGRGLFMGGLGRYRSTYQQQQ